MKWWWPSTDTMCPLVVPNVIIPPPPTHPPPHTRPSMRMCGNEWWSAWEVARWMHDEMVMTIHGHNVSTSCTERHYPPPPTHPPIPDPPCVCVGTNEEAREKWVMARWMHDEMVMTIHEHNVSTSCTERHYPPPPTHPPTPPYQTLHAYVWERMMKCVRSGTMNAWWNGDDHPRTQCVH